MKKNLLCTLALSGMCTAQTIITKAFNDPTAGETVSNYNVNGTVNNSATGSGVTFANGGLTKGSSSVTVYSAPTATEITTFPGSTLKMVNGSNTVYYKATAAKLEITGLVTTDATLNFSVNNGTFISYPAAYGYTETDPAQGTFSSSLGVSGTFTGTVNITADAAGTLVIGSKTYPNVVRIKSIQNFSLSAGFPIGTITNTAYTYYDNLHKFPLLSTTSATIVVPLASVNQTTNGAQALNETFLAVSDLKKNTDFTIYPNPAQGFIHFSGKFSDLSKASIYSLDGRLIKTTDMKSGTVEVAELTPAAYFIEVSGKNTQPQTVKFIKK